MNAASDTYDFVALGLLAWVSLVLLALAFTHGYERGQRKTLQGYRYCVSCRGKRATEQRERARRRVVELSRDVEDSGINEVPRAHN